ncbi:MAG TPA: hypothetical protein VJW17_09430, partial [Pyrinomonadaceae bacterium]|nr:hypothetical protein [Pyrinomonadaceae bacterium]
VLAGLYFVFVDFGYLGGEKPVAVSVMLEFGGNFNRATCGLTAISFDLFDRLGPVKRFIGGAY